jgi:hypothetical protein
MDKDFMKPLNGTSRCRRLALLLALSSCALQVLGFSLPSLVVCYRADRSPQVEFFAGSCACRQAARHSDCPHDAPCLEVACTDIRLGAPAAIIAATIRHHAPAGSGRFHRVNERPMSLTGAMDPRPACLRRGSPGASAPPLLSVTPASSRLRC